MRIVPGCEISDFSQSNVNMYLFVFHYIILYLDRPGAPTGPLEISDIHAEGCKLKWKPPAEDGGVPVEHYAVEKMDTATGRWVPVGRSLGPEIDVGNLEPGICLPHTILQIMMYHVLMQVFIVLEGLLKI